MMDTDRERQLRHEMARMLVIGRRLGYTVDQCIRAVRAEQKLVHGAYDAWFLTPDTQIEDVFGSRRYWHEVKRHRRRDVR